MLLLSSCGSQYYKTLPKEYATQERIEKAKGFAEQIFGKCKNKDYSEVQGFDIDATAKRRAFTPAKIEYYCKKFNEKYGAISVEKYHSAITSIRPIDYSDTFIYKIKTEKSDSIKYILVGLFRDKDFVHAFILSQKPEHPIYKRKK